MGILPDQGVELQRETIEKALAQGKENEELLYSMTNLDHPIQAATITQNLTLIEMMRGWGLDFNTYTMIRGNGKNITGFTLYLKSLMGVLYPGILALLHPRSLILGLTRDKAEGTIDRLRGR